MAESERKNNPFYDSVDSKQGQDDHHEPQETDPLIISTGDETESSKVPYYKCMCSKRGCFITKRWFICLSVVAVIVIVITALFTYFPTKKHFVDTYGLPPKPDAQRGEAFYGRLPETLKPTNYNIKVTPYLDEEDGDKRFTFDGEVTIIMDCVQSTRVITLHMLSLTLHFASIVVKNVTGDETMGIRVMSTDPKYDFFMVHLDEYLSPGHEFSISIRYSGSLNSTDTAGRSVGFYRSFYQSGGQTRFIASTQLALTNARRMYPCFDEPALKATFDIAIAHRTNRWVLSNKPNIRNETVGVWNTAYFDTTEVMSPYLVAVVVSDFECKQTSTSSGKQFRVWSTAVNLQATEFALDFGSQSLSFFEQKFGIPDPMPKVDMVALPLLDVGAMENWGLITYQDSRLLVREGVDPPSQRQAAALVIAHELSHSWFGNLVTCAWWNDAWLNEGFGRFLEYVAVDNINPDWQMYQQFYHDRVTLSAMMVDGTYASHPTVRSVGWYDDIWDQFGKQSYERGSAMLMMLQSFLGEEVFYAGLRQYLQDNAYESVHQDDLWSSLTKADVGKGDNNIKEIMDPWLLQLGYPVVTVTRTGSQVTAVQERFLLDPNDAPLIPGQYPDLGYWSIPLTYTHSGNVGPIEPQHTWLTSQSVTFELTDVSADDWLLVNVGHSGYYRVNYDYDNWNELISQLHTNHQVLPTQNRVALIDDSFNLAQAQRLSFNVSLLVMEYLENERDFGPWKAVENGIQYVDRMLKRSALYGDLRRFMKAQVSPLISQMGWNLSALNHVDYHSATVAIRIACNFGGRNCTTKARELFSEWLADPVANSINVDIRESVLCAAMMYVDGEDWGATHTMLENSKDAQLSADIKSALACNTRPWILQNYMEMYLHTDQAVEIISYVGNATAVGFLMAWDFATEYFDILAQNDEAAAYDLIWQFTNTMNSQADKDKYDDFGRKYNNMPADSALGFYTGLRKLNTNIQWMDMNYQEIETFLKSRAD